MGKNYTLIISNKFDYCTDLIIKWLKYYKMDFLIIDPNNKVQINKISINNQNSDIELNIQGKEISLSQINSVIFWKGRIEFELPAIHLENEDKNVLNSLDKFLKRELKTIIQYIYDELNKKKIFGLCITKNPNKLILLSLAKEVGLKIPNTVVSSFPKQIRKNFSFRQFITKPIQEIFTYRSSTDVYTTFTQQCNDDCLDDSEDLMFPSLIQENIIKKYELRIFYFNEEFYTMAIFSQSDDKTKVDFRDYNFIKPNRMIPYNLPDEIKIKLKEMIKITGYHSCSFDMIVNQKNEYVFLEVNPLGQFNLETLACNFKIEKKVVEVLNN